MHDTCTISMRWPDDGDVECGVEGSWTHKNQGFYGRHGDKGECGRK